MQRLLTRNYIRVYLWIGIVFTATIFVFFMFLADQFSKYAYNQMNVFQQEKTMQTSSHTEFILNQLKSYAINMYEDRSIQQWLQSDQPNPLNDMAILQTLSHYMSTEPFIKRIYLINDQKSQVVDSEQGVLALNDFADDSILSHALDSHPLFLQFFRHEHSGEPYLALVLPSAPITKDDTGKLVLLLDSGKLEAQLLGSKETSGTELAIIDDVGNIVLGTLPVSQSRLPLLPQGIEEALPETASIELGGTRLFVHSAPMASQRWTVYSLTELSVFKEQVDGFRNQISLYSMLLLVLLLGAACWNSQRAMKPFRHLAEQLQRKFKSDSVHDSDELTGTDDYHILKSGIELLSNRVKEMHHSLRDHYTLIKAEQLRQWLLQGRMNQTLQASLLKKTDLLAYTEVLLAVVKVESYHVFSEKYDFSSRQLLKYSMGNIAEELVAGKEGTVESIDLAGDHIVLLIGMRQEERMIQSVLEKVRQHIGSSLGLPVIMAMSGKKPIHDDLRVVYDFTHELTLLKFYNGDDKVYTEQDYEDYMSRLHPYSEQEGLDNLILAVKAGQKDQVVNQLDDLFAELRTLKYAECKIQLAMVLFTIMKTFNKLSAMHNAEGVERQLDRFTTLHDVRCWLEQELMRIMDRMNDRRGLNRKDKLVEEMKAYIHYHYQDPQLSADDIAQNVSLSSKYAREMFQSSEGVPVASYITRLRVDRAKELLLQTDLPVEDIVKQSGFTSRSHFFTTFKKSVGVTPNQFRQHADREEGTG